MRRALAAAVPVVVLLVAAAGCGSGDDDDPARQDQDPALSESRAEDVVRDYVEAVHGGDYTYAALVLVGGPDGGADGARPDLDPLGIDDVSAESVAAGLRRYCQPGCAALTGIDLAAQDDGGYKATVAFGEPRGHPLNRTLVVGMGRDGDPYVRGLPPAGEGQIPRATA